MFIYYYLEMTFRVTSSYRVKFNDENNFFHNELLESVNTLNAVLSSRKQRVRRCVCASMTMTRRPMQIRTLKSTCRNEKIGAE